MLLECHNLNFTYPQTETIVINNLSFSMADSGFKAVFGPSGVGKTSLAKLIANGINSFTGKIKTHGLSTILYSYNLERLPGWASIGNHLSKVTPEGRDGLKTDLIGIFKLEDLMGSRFSQLSMGQQNRINLIRYLLQDFDLLIMDESLANVDEKLRQDIILAIKTLFNDKMFLYISHNLREVSKFCSDILVFSDPKGHKGYSMVKGQDCKSKQDLDKEKLDQTILEIMNAF
ncbi:MAG: ATP-binding cassette domain-containing protein [Desulfobacteraceae bacterium]|nr:ATP-binding cassette domain-containing protein [Desulfobacteraceae bacterium]